MSSERNKQAFEKVKALVDSENERQEMFKKNLARRDGGTDLCIQTLVNELEHLFQGQDLDPFNLPDNCPTCDKPLNTRKITLSKGMARLLIKIKDRMIEHGKNDIDVGVGSWPELSKSEYCNVSTLRYFGLLHYVRDEEKKKVGGHWLLTRKGNQWLRGEAEVCAWVRVFNDRIVEKSPVLVSIGQVLKDSEVPEWPSKDEVIFGYEKLTPEQMSLI